MEKKFLIPEAELIFFENEDIIRTSGKDSGDLPDPSIGDEQGFGS